MRSTFALIGVVLAATLVVGQTCPAAPANDPFAGAESCLGLRQCQALYCACIGSSSTGFDCKPASTTSCATLTTCLGAVNGCATALAAARLNATDSCFAFGSAVHQAQLAAATGAFAGSALQASCAHGSCMRLSNTTFATTCTFGTNYSTVCVAPSAPATLSPAAVAAIRATLRLSGGSWDALLNDPTKKSQLITALTVDLAGLIGVGAAFITIISLALGSLVIDFSVAAGSGRTPDQLQSSVQTAAASTTWLTSTKSAYAAVSSETLTVLGVTVTATGAPTTTTGPGGSTPSSVTTQAPSPTSAAPAATFVLAALLAVAAVLA